MKLLLDSCISKFAVTDLRNAGHDVIWIPETGSDPGDEAILSMANTQGRVLVTADKDFGDLVFIFNKTHLGIIRIVDLPAKQQGVSAYKTY